MDFYRGFEGEPGVIISSLNVELRIWNGYFDPIMELLFNLEIDCFEEVFGIAAQWCMCMDYWEKTEIDNINREISILQKACLDNMNKESFCYLSEEWKYEIKEVLSKMLMLFEKAYYSGEKVYIEEY